MNAHDGSVAGLEPLRIRMEFNRLRISTLRKKNGSVSVRQENELPGSWEEEKFIFSLLTKIVMAQISKFLYKGPVKRNFDKFWENLILNAFYIMNHLVMR